ncbi:LysR family transcriptional regulator [Frondihabitans cladoniiphilus]|uniref:HTH lysR-type domain-containing protein n=1 Tax=Frondihabitans cladoniiphilus TaxID=715785 RepID=A0ABP8WBB3_9MICO
MSNASLIKVSHLRHFVVAADELHFLRAAQKLEISRQKLNSSLAAVELQYGKALFVTDGGETRLTKTGEQALRDAREELAQPSTPPPAPPRPAGGKAKASKGQGRAPVVKGEPKPFKKRQGR